MKATIGRIVHFRETPDARCQAAIVTAEPNDDDQIEVTLFRGGNDTQQPWAAPSESTQWRTGISADGTSEGPTWHWPEREEDPQDAAAPAGEPKKEAEAPKGEQPK